MSLSYFFFNAGLTKVKKILAGRGLLDRKSIWCYLNSIRKTDVFIASYPKSGNTWVRFIIANLLTRAQVEITFRNIDDYVPDLYKSQYFVNSIRGKRFIKTHHCSFHHFSKMIYVIRDGRDVMVSYYHYLKDRVDPSINFSEFLKNPKFHFFGNWGDHVSQALEKKAMDPENVLILKYEDLLFDPVSHIHQISNFCGFIFEDCIAQVISDKCSFKNLKSIEMSYGGEKGSEDKVFFRQGRANDWIDSYSPEDLEFFLSQNGKMLKRCGYLS